MQVCFSCGGANPPDAPQCETCGADLPAGQSAPPPPLPVADDPSESRCPFCSLPVEKDAVECPHCRLNLDSKNPLNAPAPRGHADNMTARYMEFQGKVEAVRLGKLARPEFAVWLNETIERLLAKRQDYMLTVRESGYIETHPAEVDLAMNGILDFEEAASDMLEFARSQADISALDAALAKMWQANDAINDAMRMNRSFRAQLEDDWGYM